MSNVPPLMLGGIEISHYAGAPELTEQAIGGESVLRLSGGAAVKMQRWERMAGSISGNGLMPPGLDGLDYSQPLELRTWQPSTIQGAGLVFTLTSTPRPDKAPWAFARVGGQWVPAPCSTAERQATVTPVPGASAYQVWWFPIYSVFASRPPRSQSTTHGWSISWEEA